MDEATFSESTRGLLREARRLFELTPPSAPAEGTYAEYEQWLGATFKPWLSKAAVEVGMLLARLDEVRMDTEDERFAVFAMKVRARTLFWSLVEVVPLYWAHAADPDLRAIARRTVIKSGRPWIEATEIAAQRCLEHVPSRERRWKKFCENERQRFESLREESSQLVGRAAAPPPPKAKAEPFEWPEVCSYDRGVKYAYAEPNDERDPPRVWVRVAPNESPLLASEHERLASSVRQFLLRQGYDVITPAEMRAIDRANAKGRLTSKMPACEVAPSLARVVRAHVANPIVADVRPSCRPPSEGKGCSLYVGLEPLQGEFEIAEPTRWEADVAAPGTDVDAWITAIDALRPLESEPEGIYLGAYPSGLSMWISLHGGAWAPADEQALEELKPEFERCFVEGDIESLSMTLDVNQNGGVASIDEWRRRPVPRCVSNILRRLKLARLEVPAIRRAGLHLYLQIDPASRPEARITGIADEDALLQVKFTLHRAAFQRAVAECHLAATESIDERQRVTVARLQLSLDGRGRVQRAKAEPVDVPSANADAFARCMTKALKTTAWTCPSAGQPAEIDVVYCQGTRNEVSRAEPR